MRDSNPVPLGLVEVLTIVFVVLKLTGNVDWSWWTVLSPMLIVLAIAFSVVFWRTA